MGRSANNLTPKKNTSEERLRATPFNSVAELETEARAIRLAVWRKFNEAQVIHELLTKPENAFVLDEWREGLVAFFGTEPKERIFKIFSTGKGLQLEINKEFTQSLGEHEVKFIEGVIRAGIEGYGTLYMRAKSLIKDPDLAADPLAAVVKPAKKDKKR